jgi:hypothetical protein
MPRLKSRTEGLSQLRSDIDAMCTRISFLEHNVRDLRRICAIQMTRTAQTQAQLDRLRHLVARQHADVLA